MPRPTSQDLAGYWDMLQLSVEDVSMKFDELQQLKLNDWKVAESPERKVRERGCAVPAGCWDGLPASDPAQKLPTPTAAWCPGWTCPACLCTCVQGGTPGAGVQVACAPPGPPCAWTALRSQPEPHPFQGLALRPCFCWDSGTVTTPAGRLRPAAWLRCSRACGCLSSRGEAAARPRADGGCHLHAGSARP